MKISLYHYPQGSPDSFHETAAKTRDKTIQTSIPTKVKPSGTKTRPVMRRVPQNVQVKNLRDFPCPGERAIVLSASKPQPHPAHYKIPTRTKRKAQR